MTTTSFVLKRLADDWKLLVAIFTGITVAATLLSGAPIYISTLERQGINTAIDRADQYFLNIYAIAPYVTLSRESLDTTEQAFEDAANGSIAEIYRSRERYLKTPTFLAGTGRAPLISADRITADASRASRGYFQHLTNLADHVTFREGRMAGDDVSWSGGQPSLEAVVSSRSATAFGLEAGDVVVFTPSLSDPTRASVEIVGILEVTDPSEEYWQQNANIYIDPSPLDEIPDAGVEVDPNEPPLPLFVSRSALIEGIGGAYPGTLLTSTWFVFIDKEGLKGWDKTETRARLAAMEFEVSSAMQGSAVLTGIERLLDRFERRSFFTSVPLLVLLVVTAVTVLYYILMMVSYLVSSREKDVALLRSRGVGAWRLSHIYAVEGLAITLIAAALAPFLAMGAVALAGKLAYFQEITLGAFLPVSIQWEAFAVSAGAGLLCMAIYVIPGVVGARTGLIVHRLRSSRPPSAPFFQRYYVDVGLMAVGGLVFWELFSRGQIISGGLFGESGVNEALLFAPVLLLTVVALLFMRFFPLIVRYLSGDSPALAHLTGSAVLALLAAMAIIEAVRGGEMLGWVLRVAHLAAIGALYAGTWKARRRVFTVGGFAAQTALIALFVYRYAPSPDAAAYVPTVMLAALPPTQLLFVALRSLSKAYPVWASLAIWRMARNPLQYSWLVLLVVMVTGLGILATTVGGTLDRSYEERVLYEVAADLRITGVPSYSTQGNESMKRRYLAMPGVSSVSLALRGEGSVGATYSGNAFNVLAVESEEFPYMSWYRDDFSVRPLPQVMSLLRTGANLPAITLPEGADTLHVWARPVEEYSNIYLWMVIQDKRGITETITFGPVIGAEWALMESQVPRHLQSPMSLVSVQIYEPAFGPGGTAGTILLDDIHATANGGETHMLDDFEGQNNWTPLSTSMISRDTIGFTRREVKNGERSGAFVFGKDTDRGIRGFYRSPSGGPVPVVASASFARRTGTAAGDSIIVNVFSRLIPVRIMDTVDYFPTMNPAGNGFLISDLEAILRHLNILSPVGSIHPNELLVDEAPGAEDEVYRLALSLAAAPDMVHHRARLLDAIRLDPLITAGWRAMMLVALSIVIFVTALGYATYLLSFSARSRNEMGFLQALGFRHAQMTRLLSAEHLVIAVIGLVIGTAAGFAMSSVMVSALAITEDGRPVVPPFILTTDWAYMAAVYAAMCAIFVGALLWLARSVTRVKLHEMARLEGE